MRNKRRSSTTQRRKGTETGSVTYQVTFYPDRFEQDKYICENLDLLKGVGSGASGWLREAAIAKAFGMPNEPEVKKAVASKAPPVEGVADKVADSMGLKFGKKKE